MYQMKATFWTDFEIADAFGIKAIEDTYKRAFKEWKTDYIYLTELVLVLNWRCWLWYDKGNEKMSQCYQVLYYKAHNYALSHLKGKELTYYFRTTD